jgi:predicted transcriptional regulator
MKAKIIEAKVNTNAQGSDIAEELGIPERTVQNILQTEFAEVCGESVAVANLITRNDKLQSSADTLLQNLIDA